MAATRLRYGVFASPAPAFGSPEWEHRHSREFNAMKDRLGLSVSRDLPREPAYVWFMPRPNERRVFTFDAVGVGSLGLPRGPHRNPHYHHMIELSSGEFSALLHFQSSLPDLVGREMLFRHNTGPVSNYQEPIGLWCGNTAMPGGRPVLEGILRVNQLDVVSKTGEVATLDAEAIFWPDVVRGVPRSRERPPGYLSLNLTRTTKVLRP